MKNSQYVKSLAISGMFAALIYVATMISIPIGNGYIHIGDSINYLASSLLPFPLGAFAGAIGGALSDLTLGYVAYILPTFIIKFVNSLMIYLFVKHSTDRIFGVRAVIATIFSGIVTVVGYYFTAVILYGGFKAQLATIPGNILQAVGSAVVFLILAKVFDSAKLTVFFKKHSRL